MNTKRTIHRLLRSAGYRVERYRDHVADLCALAGDDIKRVVDGGAYRGSVSEQFLVAFPEAEIHAFEPQADLYSELAARSSKQPRWIVHNSALSEAVGTATFHIPKAAFTASLLVPDESFGASDYHSVATTTLDNWASTYGPAEVLKLDLQGAELRALRGAATLLQSVRVILCEVNFVSRYEECALFHEIVAHLADFGFVLHRVYDLRSLPGGAWELGDAVFVRKP